MIESRPAEQVEVGDAIVFLGAERRVAEIEPYVGPFPEPVGIARSADGWGITLWPGQPLDVVGS